MPLLHRDVARKGGKKCLEKIGKEGYSEMGKKGAIGKVAKYGDDYMTKTQPIRMMIGRWKHGNITRDRLNEYLTRKGIDPVTIPE